MVAVPEAVDAGWQIKDWVESTGLAVTFGLGVWNYFQNRQIRSATGHVEEFRSQIREPITAALNELEKAIEPLRALARPTADTVAKLRNKIVDETPSVEEAGFVLRQCLRDSDQSAFSNGQDWESSISGQLERAQAKLEQATALAVLTVDRIRTILAEAITLLNEIRTIIKSRIDAEMKKLLAG